MFGAHQRAIRALMDAIGSREIAAGVEPAARSEGTGQKDASSVLTFPQSLVDSKFALSGFARRESANKAPFPHGASSRLTTTT